MIWSAPITTGAYLRAVNFTNCILWHTVFKGAVCKNARFFNADLTGADMARAEMLGARFDGAIVSGVRNVSRAIFRWYLPPAETRSRH